MRARIKRSSSQPRVCSIYAGPCLKNSCHELHTTKTQWEAWHNFHLCGFRNGGRSCHFGALESFAYSQFYGDSGDICNGVDSTGCNGASTWNKEHEWPGTPADWHTAMVNKHKGRDITSGIKGAPPLDASAEAKMSKTQFLAGVPSQAPPYSDSVRHTPGRFPEH